MSIRYLLKTISKILKILLDNHLDISVFNRLSINNNRHFYLKGESISPYLLRCGLFGVDDHVFIGRCLAPTQPTPAANSTREWHRIFDVNN
jgi:hypothetical protein